MNTPSVPLRTIFLAFLQVGLTAYGMAILQKLRALVIRRGWLTEEETNEGLAMVQLYPGPIMVDFTAYMGYRVGYRVGYVACSRADGVKLGARLWRCGAIIEFRSTSMTIVKGASINLHLCP
ncbi:MAG: hypothetical protein AUK53_03740 [Betaproteobacteria bacterium CG2_30_59_46]|nr:MAG: hypothetical protein AUK53_03740 [Betaproteobacteria bacterium CG2_30_59_46]PIQ09806.1 MAG: hypothetical protein COW70_14940 [Hydrogenophilales bacterium CG18_big_fil_WC_8_21_14_2_50_58_12]PIY00992.1 MAG: hypothetical protein COZ23_05600 [Hydrogenophilales bacterium CG_4_10_14_3_um_filter_58_23]PJB07556.1 MAG: hypothetical protein CO125_04535 [Hydrogenophilales bacterium CG_4_9_14_3_um_filter_59_35]